RLRADDRSFGHDAKASGTCEKADNLFDNARNTYGHFALNEKATFDLGAGSAMAPDAIEFEVTTSTRPVLGYRLEGSNDGTTWITLHEFDDERMTGTVKQKIDLSSLDAKAILTAKQVQRIEFPVPDMSRSPVELAATASSGLPLSYAVIEGPAEVNGNRLTPKAAGRVRVRAVQPGNNAFYSAAPVEQVLNITGVP
ncbi:MAG: hypothetical protein AAF492_07525, partial [Verrucomicrobiota bacterium]